MKTNKIVTTIGLSSLLVINAFALSGCNNGVASADTESVQTKDVTADYPVEVKSALKELEKAQQLADKIDICVQSGYVAGAFSNAKMEKEYEEWQQKQHKACEIAGIN